RYVDDGPSAGYIVSCGRSWGTKGVGSAGAPCSWWEHSIDGWRLVTEAVHELGGRFFRQLWPVGRVSDPVFLDGALPVAPSAIAPGGHVRLVRPQRPYVTPRALDLDEIPGVVDACRRGAENARAAGFDGVQVHGANRSRLNKFLQGRSNRRDPPLRCASPHSPPPLTHV
ncbi:hypothetical protein NX905_29820, partial [Burkholderia thailandensis]|nr:hypothetical protein [Burkholderia thailandensis]